MESIYQITTEDWITQIYLKPNLETAFILSTSVGTENKTENSHSKENSNLIQKHHLLMSLIR